jgi:lipopolysaccharide/colanic/teichoic acid biosynthesis glycosyltransferase
MSKRVVDRLFGFFVLILALPLMALSALLVYLEDGFPVIFRQTRVGRNGCLFEIHKFRTIVVTETMMRLKKSTAIVPANPACRIFRAGWVDW